MTNLAALLAQLRDGEPLPHRVRLFDLAIVEALRMERTLDEVVANSRDEAEAAEREAATLRAAVAAGNVVHLPHRARRRFESATFPGAA